MKKSRVPWRTFFAAFVLTLCVLGLGCAFLVIEYNIQHTTYGQVDFGVSYTMTDGLPSVAVDGEQVLSPSPTVARLGEAMVPPPVRLLLELWHSENELAVTILTWLK